MRKLLGLALVVAGFSLTPLAQAQEKVVVWWNKGFYEAEDKALRAAIEKWEKQSGMKVELSLFATEDMITKTVSAVESGNPPDLAFGWTFDFRASPTWAFQGKLEDVSDIIEPLKDKYLPVALDGVNLFNGKTNRRSYYAIPIEQQAEHVHYWLDMLQDAGIDEKTIPRKWEEFWSFWCDKVQPAVRRKTGKRVYGVGLPLGTSSTDTYYTFYHFMLAYGADWLDKDGKLHVDDAEVKARMVQALDSYMNIYRKGCTPPGSMNWTDAGNNENFHNLTTVMTPNPSLSIPGKHLDDRNENNYYRKIRTVEWPDQPDGSPITYMVSVKQAVVFADSKNKKGAKSFISFLIKPENLGPYIEGAFGRWYPVMPELANTPFWTEGKDPHRSVAHRQYTSRTLIPFPQVWNYKAANVQAENLWGKATGRVGVDGWTSERAVDELIARIKELMS